MAYFASNKEGIHSRILLKGNLRHKVKGTGKIYLREGEFTMLWADSANCNCRFEKDTEYRTLDIFYSPSLFQQLIISWYKIILFHFLSGIFKNFIAAYF